MGSTHGYRLGKGPFAYLDGLFDGTDAAAYEAAKVKLAGSLQEAAANRFGATDPKVQHFQEDWLGRAWSDLRPEETLKAGLTRAITRAQGDDPSHPKPMEFFWVPCDDDVFHVYYSDGPHQVTVIIVTPFAGALDEPSDNRTTPEPVWVVKQEDFETTPAGQDYPGTITELAEVAAPFPATIIERQLYRN